MSNYVLFRGNFIKSYILLKRYIVNTVAQIGTIYILFLLIFFGGQAVAGRSLNDSLGGIIVGFFLFTMTQIAFSSLAQTMTQEAQWGTLEQLYMTPFGIGRVITIQTVVNLLWSFVWGSLILVLMLVTTGETLIIDFVTVVPLGILTIASAIGLGFALGGLALLYKRISAAFQLMQFVFIGLLSAPVTDVPLAKFLPLSLGSYLLRQSMQNGTSLWNIDPTDLGILVGVAVVYTVVGYVAFTLCQRRARKLGVLGDY
ncbi:hypothetical protein ZOD2009_09263 [Haladaptatus paucihalophilus DX253]|uniref:ABC-2 type transport system permease protein n=1 Tax=Haladaptatus paucihalophilus DX253 TaxID=797209 RepID=E7QSS7_HALPU|nr:hypothetical protein [Haladaptatus paucihalophilus]EFW92486.1 hypothetical protein ZOD2009_09263 [Haladaptatus paucihalophilus DX253]SHK07603.1 ABC-2 type transport system permease protein [Haladaptatus paucihalophilus DX253]